MAEPVYGFNRKDAEGVVELLGGEMRQLIRRPFLDHGTELFLARSPSGGIAAATGSWPAITVGSEVCDLAWINGSNVLGPALGLDGSQLTETLYNIADTPVGGSKILFVAREYMGYKSIVIWELC